MKRVQHGCPEARLGAGEAIARMASRVAVWLAMAAEVACSSAQIDPRDAGGNEAGDEVASMSAEAGDALDAGAEDAERDGAEAQVDGADAVTPGDVAADVADATGDAGVDARQDAGVDAQDGPVDATGAADSAEDARESFDTGGARDVASEATATEGRDAATGDGGGGDAASSAVTFRVVRVGDGTTTLSNASAPVFIEEHSLAGDLVSTIALPTAGDGTNRPLTLSGSATSEGALSRSADGRFLSMAGYATGRKTPAVASTTAASVPRVVARLDGQGTVDTSTTLDAAFDGNNVRGATSLDGRAFWVSGAGTSSGGIWQVPFGATGGARILATPSSVRVPGVFGGQLFATSAATPFNTVFTVGGGVPTAADQSAVPLPGPVPAADASPFGFVFFDLDPATPGMDTLYLADDRVTGGGVEAWTFDGTSWSRARTLAPPPPVGCRGLAGFQVAGVVTLIASTAETPSNRLVVFVDDRKTSPATGVVIATAPANEVYRGVALSPSNAP